MAINKVTLNGETQMDVTDDTVAPSNLLTGYQATGANGQKVQGAVNGLVPAGGTAGQVLKKNSATDYDTTWGEAGGGGALVIPVTQIDNTTNGYSLPTELQTSAAFNSAISNALADNKQIIVKYIPLSGSPKLYYYACRDSVVNYYHYFVNPEPKYDGTSEVCIIDVMVYLCKVIVRARTFFPTSGWAGDCLVKQYDGTTSGIAWQRINKVTDPSSGSAGQVLTLHDPDSGWYGWDDSKGENIGYCRIDGNGEGSSDPNDWTAVYWDNAPGNVAYDIGAIFDNAASQLLNKLCIYVNGEVGAQEEQPFVLNRMYRTYDYDNEDYEPGECARAVLEFSRVSHNFTNHTTKYEKILLFGVMWEYIEIGIDTPFSFTADPMYNKFFARYYVDTV